ncbi:DsbA family protein [Pelagibaculum spongiae]|uniref:Disulfide bond formation protein DsbA n=1 Tax=Pelagibaculum spongiae TaxID=2080658 RepID=A0A2V1GT45_9GAMM|nr:DsbA family protein [Pelagibaculum spongiae]PVZ64533.1 disulfide bond formation protein DsbA [Pelagibaculum spongiae]
MKGNQLLISMLSIISIGLIVFNIYFYSELSSLQAAHESSSKTHLSHHDIIQAVDDRLASLKKRNAKAVLSRLEEQFQLANETTPDNRLIYGNPNAKITLQEYGDIECPYCRKMHGVIKQVVHHSQGVINWEFKHFPLGIHNPVAAVEGQAIECIKASYNNRIAWIALDKFMMDTRGNGQGINDVPEYVRSFGLNGSLIGNCLASDDHQDKINQDYQDGQRLGISATPAVRIIDNTNAKTYLLGGYKTSEQLLQAIQRITWGG